MIATESQHGVAGAFCRWLSQSGRTARGPIQPPCPALIPPRDWLPEPQHHSHWYSSHQAHCVGCKPAKLVRTSSRSQWAVVVLLPLHALLWCPCRSIVSSGFTYHFLRQRNGAIAFRAFLSFQSLVPSLPLTMKPACLSSAILQASTSGSHRVPSSGSSLAARRLTTDCHLPQRGHLTICQPNIMVFWPVKTALLEEEACCFASIGLAQPFGVVAMRPDVRRQCIPLDIGVQACRAVKLSRISHISREPEMGIGRI